MKKISFLLSTIIIFSLLLSTHYVHGQSKELLELAKDLHADYKVDSINVANFLQTKNLSKRYVDDNGRIVELVKVIDGRPIYKTELNAGAAATTNADLLYEGEALGLSLSGTGITVGVWDGGRVGSHVEFGDRVVPGDGASTLSDHATHVMGTILAKGINSSAKGMAYNAKGKFHAWDNDLAEMTSFAATGGLLSNHSYGVVTGWNNGVWNGDPAISKDEDYKFGFYGFDAPQIDNIAFNAPYYLVVKSAGNDRNDSGPTNPADGNMGSGFDSVGPAGTAKNGLTVGAVEKLFNYTAPEDVVMSSFSSWGPTDDGRIKPDIVGAGVGLLSTSSSGEESYTTKNGTSMSAPNVTGSLVLLQEHFSNLNSGLFMRSSTLKGLIIQTAREAGRDDGPDYSFGWGLLDVASAANHISRVDQENYVLLEEQIGEGEEFAMDIYPQKDTKVTATICWIDPAGQPSASVLDPEDLRLVNDLDIRIVDDAGNEFQPWIMNPAIPHAAASKGDNFRDNVEKIEFIVPTQRKYTVKVNHKNSLQNGMQEFSLLLTQNSIDNGVASFYYIGEDGNWDDPNNWSLTSGGNPEGVVPDAASNVIFDENSFQTSNSISLTSNISVNSISWFALEGNNLDLNQNTLTLTGDIIMAEKLLNPIGNGTLLLAAGEAETSLIYTANSVFNNLDLVVNSGLGQINVYDSLNLRSLVFNGGEIDFVTNYLSVNDLVLNGDASSEFDMRGLKVEIDESLEIQSTGTVVSDILSWLEFNSSEQASINTVSNVDFKGTVTVNTGGLVLSGDFKVNLLEAIAADVIIQNSLEINNFNVVNGSFLTIADGETLSVNEYISFSSVGTENNGLKSVGSEKAFLQLNLRTKYCFSNVEISNVDLLGNAVLSLGSTSVVTDSENWLEVDCGSIIFAEFEYQDVCAGGLTKFADISSGEVENRVWEVFDGATLLHSTTDSVFYFSFSEIGNYEVKLSVNNTQQANDVIKEVEIVENNLEANRIVDNETSLASVKLADNYQWYLNNQPIEGATERVYNLPEDTFGEALYFVVSSDDGGACNIKSENLSKIVTDVEDIPGYNSDIIIYPNPSSGSINLVFAETGVNYEVKVTGLDGRTVYSKSIRSGKEPVNISLGNLTGGMFILTLDDGASQIQRRILIQK